MINSAQELRELRMEICGRLGWSSFQAPWQASQRQKTKAKNSFVIHQLEQIQLTKSQLRG